MVKLTAENKNNKDHLSIKNFVMFSLMIYPVWIFWYVYVLDRLKIVAEGRIPTTILTFIVFSVINWIYGRKKSRVMVIVLFNVICFFLMVRNWASTEFAPEMAFAFGTIVYPLLFLVVTFAQFMTWIPFLAKYIYQNKGKLDNITWN